MSPATERDYGAAESSEAFEVLIAPTTERNHGGAEPSETLGGRITRDPNATTAAPSLTRPSEGLTEGAEPRGAAGAAKRLS